jgi:large subunit ribosomal protein L18
MIRKTSKNIIRTRVHVRLRKKLRGTPDRPRLAVFRSEAHIYAQVIDDTKGITMVAANSLEKPPIDKPAGTLKTGANVAAAKEIGRRVAERAKAKGINRVVFDRGGYLYHGRVKALADAAREAGLKF